MQFKASIDSKDTLTMQDIQAIPKSAVTTINQGSSKVSLHIPTISSSD